MEEARSAHLDELAELREKLKTANTTILEYRYVAGHRMQDASWCCPDLVGVVFLVLMQMWNDDDLYAGQRAWVDTHHQFLQLLRDLFSVPDA